MQSRHQMQRKTKRIDGEKIPPQKTNRMIERIFVSEERKKIVQSIRMEVDQHTKLCDKQSHTMCAGEEEGRRKTFIQTK